MKEKIKGWWDFINYVQKLADEAFRKTLELKPKNHRYNVRDKKGRFTKEQEKFYCNCFGA